MVGNIIAKACAFVGRRSSRAQRPIGIRADVLTDWKPATQGFMAEALESMIAGQTSKRTSDSNWPDPAAVQADIRRAAAAAKAAGLTSYQILVSPDGTISIVVGSDESPA